MTRTQTREEVVELQDNELPSPLEAEDQEFEFEPTIVRGRE
jgi:hypothetical protein